MNEKLIEQTEGIIEALTAIEKPNGHERSAKIHATVLLRCLHQAVAEREQDKKAAEAAALQPEQVKK